MRATQLAGAGRVVGDVGVVDVGLVERLAELGAADVVVGEADDAGCAEFVLEEDEQPAKVTAAIAPSATNGVSERRAGPGTARQ